MKNNIISEIHRQCFENDWSSNEITDLLENSQLITHEIRDKIVAFMIYRSVCDEAEIITICTLPEYRGKNIAKSLVMKAIKNLKKQSVKSMFLEVSVKNIPAQKLYSSCGFHQVGYRKNYYHTSNGKDDAVIMSYSL